MKHKFALISLGCPKNLVDSETFCYVATHHGYKQADEIRDLDFVIINTCSFIQDAIRELNIVLNQVISLKTRNKVKRVFVTGCIMKRYLREMQTKFPDVDEWINIRDYKKFEVLIAGSSLSQYKRTTLSDGPYTYLKISDGCNNNCSYCTIPSIRGKLHSSKIEDLVNEAKYLAKSGSKELIVIAQDTTAYGKDIYSKSALTELLKRLHEITEYQWIRLMYLHPKNIDNDLVKTLARLPKVVHSFEIPLQHCNDRILRQMNRNYTKSDIINIINMFKDTIPDSVFRTTFITGFPGESRKEFNELVNFIHDYPFLRMGAFAYSPESGTKAVEFPDKKSNVTAKKRKNELLSLHRNLAEQYLSAYIDKEIDVLVEETYPEEDNYVGRAWFDAPDIDGIVNFSGKNINYGDIVKVRIEDVIDIDLYGIYQKRLNKIKEN